MKKRIEEEERLNVSNDLIIRPSDSVYGKGKRQENIFVQHNYETDPQLSLPNSSQDLLANEVEQTRDVADADVEADVEAVDLLEKLESTVLDENTEIKKEQDLSPKSVSSDNSQLPIQFRLPPIDSTPGSLRKIPTPALPVMMVNPVLHKVRGFTVTACYLIIANSADFTASGLYSDNFTFIVC